MGEAAGHVAASEGGDHIRLSTLPCLTLMAIRVKATLEGIIGKSVYVMTQVCIESITLVRQFPHLDFPQPHSRP